MQNMSQIRELIMQGNGDILGLYLKIPFFIREQLDGTISRTSWERVSEGCERQDKDSLELAAKFYQSLLDRADEYIQENSQEPNTKNSAMMKLEKYRMQNEFQNDAARFASEMAVCLKKENELIFTYSEAGSTTIENTSDTKDITNQNNDMELETIEEVTKAADAYLYQAKKCIEEFDRCREIGLSFLGSYAQDAHMDEGLDEHNQEQWNGYAELQNQEMACEQLKKQLQMDKQNALAALNRAYELSLHYVDTLVNEMKAWRVALAKSSVRVGPVANYTLLINRSKRFGQCINTIFTWCLNDGNLQVIREREQTQSPDLNFSFEVGRLERDFRAILTRLLQIFETVAPKGDISIENKGKRDSPNYCTKKTQSFSTTIRVLAGECFSNFQILNTEVELVAERDLAQGSTGEVTSRNCSSCLKVETTTKSSVPEITFNIEVKNFYRVEQNNVYKQFFRLRYKVTVSINDNEYCLETLSLPFTFNTGANQILEHKGARLWYCASVQDLYSSLDQCPDPLPVDDVIKILDDRVTHLDTNSRRLTEQEKEFLKGRLPVASDGTVTMQGFLKDKMRALRTDEPLSFSFYTWFYSVIHSIEQLLLKAWQDGIIYGFCSDKNARDILMNPRIPEGTVLLRPSVSEIKRTSSADATAALVMEVKLKKDDAQLFDDHNLQYGVHSIPLLYKHIEQNTLYGAIKGIQFNNKSESAAKFLYMFGKGKKLKILKEYSKKQERKLLTEYNILIQKFQKFNIIPTTPGAPAAVVVSDEEDDNEKEPPTRKRRYRKSTSSTQRQSTLLTSAPTGIDESSGGASTLPAFSMLSSGVSSGEINQESILQMQLQSSPAVNVQSQRSGPQGQIIPGTSREMATNVNMEQNENGQQSSVWGHEMFGNIQVDFSRIPLAASRRHNVDLSQESGINGFSHADFGQENSEQRVITQINNIERQDNRVNEFFTESANSPLNNVGYNVSVTSRPASTNDYNLQDLSPASILSNNSESSLSSPSSYRLSPSQLNAQTTGNLPTVLTEATEPNRQTRRGRGNRRGRSSSSRVMNQPGFSDSVGMFTAQQNQSTQPHLSSFPNNMQHQGCIIAIDQTNNNADFVSLAFSDNYLLLEGINELHLPDSMLVSPADSGMGDQSPSPESIYDNNPLLRVFYSSSVDTEQYPPSLS